MGFTFRIGEENVCREAEVFAAYTDYEIGRVIQEVQDQGKLVNTLIIYIDGDNGTRAEGSVYGTYNQMDRLQRHPRPTRIMSSHK